LQEGASVLHYTYVDCLVVFYEPRAPVCVEPVQHCAPL